MDLFIYELVVVLGIAAIVAVGVVIREWGEHEEDDTIKKIKDSDEVQPPL